MAKKNFSTASEFFTVPTVNIEKSPLAMIPTEQLELIENQIVPGYTEEELTELSHSIKTHGVLESLVVRKMINGNYEVLSGRNRTKAAIMAGLKEIPCHIVEVDDLDAEDIMYDANFERREDIPVSVKVKVYKRKYEILKMKKKGFCNGQNDGLSHVRQNPADQMVKDLKTSRASVYRYLKLGNLKEDILEGLDQGKISQKAALKLADFSCEQQEEILKFIDFGKLTEKKLDDIKLRVDKGETLEDIFNNPNKKSKKETSTKKQSIKMSKQDIDSLVNLLEQIEINSAEIAEITLSKEAELKGKVKKLLALIK